MKPLTIRHTKDPFADTRSPDPHQDTFSKTILGFWMYLMTDCLVFAALFTTYAVLHNNISDGPSSNQIFSLSTAFFETMVLLLSSLASGFAILSALKNKKKEIIAWFATAFLLGLLFL